MEVYEYDIVLAYAGEDSFYAQTLAQHLEGVSVFFDRYDRGMLWGKNLYSHLSERNARNAHYRIVFLSQYYARALWITGKLAAIHTRMLQEGSEYILPIRLDDTTIPGILPTTLALDWFAETPEGIATLVLKRLGR